MFKKSVFGASVAALLAATSAHAATTAMATTDLNVRSGPGPQFEIVGVIDGNADVTVEGCLETANWCKVSYEGTDGWSYGQYLTAMVESEPVIVVENRDRVKVQTMTYDTTGATAAASGTAAAVIGGLIAGPAGAVAGAAIGAGLGVAADPGPQTITYVTENPVDPIYLDGEVVVGAQFPEDIDVAFYDIPDAELQYAYVNGVPVLIDPEERRIVYIVR
ncbi:hypothetical protein BV394_10970 [Brevirhabdus pacifica]|uniref:Uncharacterized protein n=1 Tax=Brevirhabdus pacifica TaxID=1267768 RepID=A0A1U7DJM2_9RHOB|nr:DUF1236 domain-containing protein [Brevirhabdus pacifica]APX90182.1 hypothetical protein BV394_10970 [Brevirhabdus pacifica]OWU78757.1 hypothetical protein ATO5_08490 [Loktanella sp. 22II-4b]PJJ80610.1 SH3 domain-containing protein [Brevirhabdus pacifica]